MKVLGFGFLISALQLHYPPTATTLWWPGEDVVESTLMSVPADTPPEKVNTR
jgi:hypothetical protein